MMKCNRLLKIRWNFRLEAVVCFCALWVLCLLPNSTAQAAGAGTPALEKPVENRIAIINLSRVFENYSKVSNVQKRVDALFEPKRKNLDVTSESLLRRQKDLSSKSASGQQDVRVFDQVQALRKDTFLFEREMESFNAEIQAEYTKEMREVLSDIRNAIRDYADKKFSIVLRAPSSDDPVVDSKAQNDPAASDQKTVLELIAPKTAEALLERFSRNPVLFGSATVDITEEVLAKLNKDYEKRAK